MMKMYTGTAYGFCDGCRRTNRPAIYELPGGRSALVCPFCMEMLSEGNAVSILPKKDVYCYETRCFEKSRGQCLDCKHEMCEKHSVHGVCAACSFVKQQTEYGPNYY